MQIPRLQNLWFEKRKKKITVMRFELLGSGMGVTSLRFAD